MRELAKLGFTQSYTYFTWKTSRYELMEYVNELAHTEEAEYFRPNFFPVTPDILEAYLVHGGPGAFVARLVLAGTLSPSYGIYSGYEHFENVPVREGSEEYLNSEKYETWERKLDGPCCRIRAERDPRENPRCSSTSTSWLETHNDRSWRLRQARPATRSSASLTRSPGPEGRRVPADLGCRPFPVRTSSPASTSTGASAATTCASRRTRQATSAGVG
jgi:starch synthase (maltosyl-transferring)